MTDEKYVRELEARVVSLEKENRELRARIEKLERLLERALAQKPRREPPAFIKENTQNREAKPSGRPEGHEGTGRPNPSEIHERVELAPFGECPDCGSPVKVKRRRKRAVTRLVPGRLENLEYDVPQCFCGSCRKTITPAIPNTLPNNRFDLSFLLYVACLRMLGVSVDKIRFLLKTNYGLHVSSATVTNNMQKLVEFLGEDYEKLRVELLKAKQVHGDETSWRVRGANWWLWEFITHKTAYFTVRHTRGHSVPAEIMKGYRGLFTADFWNAYNCLTCEKQRCWVHLKRDLDKVLKYKPSKEFARFASRLMLSFTKTNPHFQHQRLKVVLRVFGTEKALLRQSHSRRADGSSLPCFAD